MSLQFTWLKQRIPNTLRIIGIGFEGASPKIRFYSKPGKSYTIEFSTNLESWQSIAPEFPSAGYLTNFVDEQITTRLGSLPGDAFYRVSENE